MKIFTKIQYITLFGISLILIGLTSVITGDVGWDAFKEPLFYIKQVLTYAAIVSAIAGIILTIVDRFKETDNEYLQDESMIRNFAQNTFIPSIFTRYCEYANRKRKIRQHIYNVKKQLFRIEKKATENDLYLWVHDRQNAIKSGNKYCKKRAFLEEQLTQDWIEAYIDTKHVDYEKLNADIVLGGIYSKNNKFGANDYVTKNKGWIVIRAKAPKLLFSFAVSTFASSLIVGMTFNTSAIISFFTDVLVLAFNMVMSIRFANDFCQSVTLKDMRFRKGIVQEYQKWIVQQAEQTDKSKDTSEADALYDEMEKASPDKKTLDDKVKESIDGYIHLAQSVIGKHKEDDKNGENPPSS